MSRLNYIVILIYIDVIDYQSKLNLNNHLKCKNAKPITFLKSSYFLQFPIVTEKDMHRKMRIQ